MKCWRGHCHHHEADVHLWPSLAAAATAAAAASTLPDKSRTYVRVYQPLTIKPCTPPPSSSSSLLFFLFLSLPFHLTQKAEILISATSHDNWLRTLEITEQINKVLINVYTPWNYIIIFIIAITSSLHPLHKLRSCGCWDSRQDSEGNIHRPVKKGHPHNQSYAVQAKRTLPLPPYTRRQTHLTFLILILHRHKVSMFCNRRREEKIDTNRVLSSYFFFPSGIIHVRDSTMVKIQLRCTKLTTVLLGGKLCCRELTL